MCMYVMINCTVINHERVLVSIIAVRDVDISAKYSLKKRDANKIKKPAFKKILQKIWQLLFEAVFIMYIEWFPIFIMCF